MSLVDEKHDTRFLVGTTLPYDSSIVIGVFCPPKSAAQGRLFTLVDASAPQTPGRRSAAQSSQGHGRRQSPPSWRGVGKMGVYKRKYSFPVGDLKPCTKAYLIRQQLQHQLGDQLV